jgi:hypothetical protein
MKFILTMLVLGLFAASAFAQEPAFDYGKPEDLKGLVRFYVDTGIDTKHRDKIIKELTKANLGLISVDKVEQCQFIVMFGASTKNRFIANTQPNGAGHAADVTLLVGRGMVFVPQPDQPRMKLVMSFEDTQETAFERKPVNNFIKDFLKLYKQVNGR